MRGITAIVVVALCLGMAVSAPIPVNDKLATAAPKAPVQSAPQPVASASGPVPTAAPQPVAKTATTVAAPKTATTIAAPKTATTIAAPKTATTVAAPKTATTIAAPKTATTVAAPKTTPTPAVTASGSGSSAVTATTTPVPTAAPVGSGVANPTAVPTHAPSVAPVGSGSSTGSSHPNPTAVPTPAPSKAAPVPQPTTTASGSGSASDDAGLKDLTAGYQPVALKHPRPAGTVDLYRYWSPTRQDHLYLTNFKTLGMGAHGYLFQGSIGYVWNHAAENTIPLYRYFFRSQNNHYYSTEKKPTAGTRHFEGVQAHIYSYDSKAKGTVPLYLFFNERLHDHYMTTNFQEFTTEPEWEYQGVIGRIFPLPNFVESAAPGDGTTVGIRRYFNPMSGDHLLTAGSDGSDVHTWFQWMFQGVTFYCFKDAKPGTTPLRMYYNHFTSDHLATASKTLLGQGTDAWVPEGTLCHVYLKPEPKTVPLYRYYNAMIHDHFYTTKKGELDAQGWKYQGIEAYVFAQPMENAHPPMPATYGDDRADVYQWWNKLYRDHLFTTDEHAFSDYTAFGWVAQGKKFEIFTQPTRSSHPLYQVWNVHMNDMIYTTSAREMTNFTSDAWATYKGVLGHVAVRQAPGTQAIYRYWNSSFGDHMITTSILDSDEPYAYDGVLGFVPSPELYREFKEGESITSDKVDSQLVPLYQFYSPGEGDHWFSTSAIYDGHNADMDGNATHAPSEAGQVLKNANAAEAAVKSHWYFQGVAAYCQAVQTEGTVPLYWSYNSAARDSILTTEPSEIMYFQPGKAPIPCYVYPKQVPGAVALHRYFSVEDHDHFYTTRTPFMKDLPQFVYQGVAAYVFPAAVTADPPLTTLMPVATSQPWRNPSKEDPRHVHH